MQRETRRVPSVRLRCQSEEHEQDRHADPVVEAALDVECLPDIRRHSLIPHHRCAERRVRRGEHRRQNRDLEQREFGKEGEPEAQPGDNRQGQTDEQQPDGESVGTAKNAEIRRRCVGEQHQRERQLREQAKAFAISSGIDNAE